MKKTLFFVLFENQILKITFETPVKPMDLLTFLGESSRRENLRRTLSFGRINVLTEYLQRYSWAKPRTEEVTSSSDKGFLIDFRN